jgi:hypothetical protein
MPKLKDFALYLGSVQFFMLAGDFFTSRRFGLYLVALTIGTILFLWWGRFRENLGRDKANAEWENKTNYHGPERRSDEFDFSRRNP